MNIIVCLTKDYARGSFGGSEVCFWPVPDAKKPISLLVGDSVFVVQDEFIRFSHKFVGFAVDPVCSDGSISSGINLVLSYPPEKVNTSTRIPVFPHFRYIRG